MSEGEKQAVSYWLTKAQQFSLSYVSSNALNVATMYGLSSLNNSFSQTPTRLIQKTTVLICSFPYDGKTKKKKFFFLSKNSEVI
jgi:hypothetical protein